MADYLQDLLDRFNVYTDPSQYPATAFDPTATDRENETAAKKKKLLAQRAAPDTSQPAISALADPTQVAAQMQPQIENLPANPAYGANPMSSQLTQQMSRVMNLPDWAKQAGLQYGVGGLPPQSPAQPPPVQPPPAPAPDQPPPDTSQWPTPPAPSGSAPHRS